MQLFLQGRRLNFGLCQFPSLGSALTQLALHFIFQGIPAGIPHKTCTTCCLKMGAYFSLAAELYMGAYFSLAAELYMGAYFSLAAELYMRVSIDDNIMPHGYPVSLVGSCT